MEFVMTGSFRLGKCVDYIREPPRNENETLSQIERVLRLPESLRLCTIQQSFQAVAGGALFENFTCFLDNDGSRFRRWQPAGVNIRDDRVFETDVGVTAKLGCFHVSGGIGQAVDQIGREAA